MKFFSHKTLLICILVILFLIPFFWFKPNEMDLGGDATRFYFYDPVSYTINTALYVAFPTGIGHVDSGAFSQLSQMALLIALKSFLHLPYFLITIFNILKVAVGFLAVYGITKELINQKSNNFSSKFAESASILAGLFYIFSRHMVANYDISLLSHNQVFLNPLMIYLLLKYFLTKKRIYGWCALMISFIFASNFSYLGSPPFFAFYPLTIVFLFIYVRLIREMHFPWKDMFVGLLIFLGLQAFQIIPSISDILYSGSSVNTRLFNKESLSEQVGTFYGILQLARIDRTLFLPSWHEKLRILSILFPSIILLGFYLNKKREKTILLTGIFFLITFFLLTAKITQVGIEFYSRLFYIPGFSLFRNFTGIWAYVYSFFYALLFGQALFYIFGRLQPIFVKYVFAAIAIIIILSAWPFIDGSFVNKVHYQSKNVKAAIVMDPVYEETLAFIKSLPQDSKLLTLPFTDCCFQVLSGTNNGAYIGPSTIPYLTGKSDFSGYAMAAPYSDLFFRLAKKKDYESFKQMLGLLNVKYVFYNSDPKILDNFPIYPFSPDYVRKYFPNDQKGYAEFVQNIASKKVFEESSYKLYMLDDKYFLPHFYSPKKISLYDNNPSLNQYNRASSFFPPSGNDESVDDPRIIFLEREWCKSLSLEQICSQSPDVLNNTPTIFFEKINPTKYRIKIQNANESFILVFSEIFNRNWKLIDPTSTGEDSVFASLGEIEGSILGTVLHDSKRTDEKVASYFDNQISEGKHMNVFLEPKTFETWGKKEIAQDAHFEVNGYANAWLIRPSDMRGKQDYELILELTTQRPIYIVLPISLVVFIGCLFWGILLYNRKSR